jgi:hypothetical protein
VQHLRMGDVERGLPLLISLADNGDAAAAASVAEVFAFQGKLKELVPYASALLANPSAVYAGNVFADMCHLLRRAAAETSDPNILATAGARVPDKWASQRNAVLFKDSFSDDANRKPNPAGFAETVAKQQGDKRFAGYPDVFAQHCFALASKVFYLNDEILNRWDARPDLFGFDQAVDAAVAAARRKQYDRAWSILESKLSEWYYVDAAQVAPVILLVHPALRRVMTSARCERVLRTKRA